MQKNASQKMQCLGRAGNEVYFVENFNAKTMEGEIIAEISFLKGKAQIEYKKNIETDENYNFLDLQKLANRSSRKCIYYGRLYKSMNVSCAASCINERLEEYVRFTTSHSTYSIGDNNSTHIRNILDIISDEKSKRCNNGLPKIILIPYNQDVSCCCSHSVVLVVDLQRYPMENSIYVSVSAHILVGKNGINISGSFSNLANCIKPKALNKSKWQFCLRTTCTFWSEAFIVIAARYRVPVNFRWRIF